MVTGKLYIEGGGDNRSNRSKYLIINFRKGWKSFFNRSGVGNRIQIVRGGGRQHTFKLFTNALKDQDTNFVPILLVDSEGAVNPGSSVWQHLKARDNWNQPVLANDDQSFLMVQVMETWFLADRDALQTYFGQLFSMKPLKQWPSLEKVSKSTVINAIKSATANCSKPYAKGKVSFELLEQINPACVASACPHAKVLLDRLKTL